MVAFREITTGLRFPEGPIAMPDGVVVLVEIEGRRLTRVHPDGRKEVICETGGGPNGAAIARRTPAAGVVASVRPEGSTAAPSERQLTEVVSEVGGPTPS